jgi:hypothetical protein
MTALSGHFTPACYARIVKGRLCRLVGVALIVVLSGTPALAAVCAELCGFTTESPVASTHCSKHGAGHKAETAQQSAPAHHGMPAAAHHKAGDGVRHVSDEGRVAVLAHGPGCCGRVHLPIAVATKVSRAEAPSNVVASASGPYVPYPDARTVLPAPPPGSSGPPSLSRAPLILRI